MFSLTSLLPFALVAVLPLCKAIITPTSPDGSTVVRVGATLNALWTADNTGMWNNTQIQLMTGDNFNMIPLSTLATGIDGTTTTTFSTPCPAVSPNAKIYFLQFTQGGDVTTATWTTRFTIAAQDGSTSQPTNTTNYSGTDVQWGVGALLDGAASNSSNSAAPSVAASSASTSAVAIPSTSSGLTLYNPSSASASATGAVSSGGAVAAASASSASARVSSATSAGAAAASSSRSAAGAISVGASTGATVGLLGMVLGLML